MRKRFRCHAIILLATMLLVSGVGCMDDARAVAYFALLTADPISREDREDLLEDLDDDDFDEDDLSNFLEDLREAERDFRDDIFDGFF